MEHDASTSCMSLLVEVGWDGEQTRTFAPFLTNPVAI